MEATEREIYDFYSHHLEIRSHSGSQIMAFCPFHENTQTPALSLNIAGGMFECKAPTCGKKGNMVSFAKDRNIPLDTIPGWDQNQNGDNSNIIEKTWDYRDSDGTLLFQEIRFFGKQTRFRKPSPFGTKEWVWNIQNVKRVLYRQNELMNHSSSDLYVVEGPKDVDSLVNIGLNATTSPLGAKSWKSEYAQIIRKFNIIVIPDNDDDGKYYANAVSSSLAGLAPSVKVLRLPGLMHKQDITDWLEMGHTPAELAEIVKNTLEVAQTTPTSKLDAMQPISALLQQSFPADDWLVEKIWPYQARGWIAGSPGSNKTWFAMEMGFSIATGQPFLGEFPIPKPGKVLYIQQELMERHHQQRWNLMLPPKNLTPDTLELFKSNFYHITNKQILFPNDTDPLIEKIKDMDFQAIFLDSYSQSHTANENLAHEMAPVLMDLSKLQNDTGAAVIVIHHLIKSNKETSGRSIFEKIRGSSALWAWRNAVIGMTVDPQDDSKSKVQFQFQVAETPAEFIFVRENVENGFIFNRLSIEDTDEFGEKCDKIFEFLEKSKSPVSFNKISAAVKGRRDTNRKAITNMEMKGSIEYAENGYKIKFQV